MAVPYVTSVLSVFDEENVEGERVILFKQSEKQREAPMSKLQMLQVLPIHNKTYVDSASDTHANVATMPHLHTMLQEMPMLQMRPQVLQIVQVCK